MGAPRRIRSMRGRLIFVVSCLLLTALAILLSTSIVILRESLVAQVESTLYLSNDSAETRVSSALEQDGALPGFDDVAIVVPPDGFFVVLDEETPRVSAFFTRDYVYRAMSADELAELQQYPFRLADTHQIELDDHGSYLLTATTVAGPQGEIYTVVTGVGLADTDAVVATSMLWITTVGLLLATLVAGIGYRLVSRELEPLEHVARVAQEVSATPLASGEISMQSRAPRDRRSDGSEVDRVAVALNRLLEHVETSLNTRHRAEESMRRFIAEASHELRNPLASIRGYAEFYSQSPAEPEEIARALGRVGAEAKRMSTLVDDLLLLARLDADPRMERDDVDISQVVLEIAADCRFAFPGHTWNIAVPDAPVVVTGDEDAIRQMLLNLVVNAGHHTPAGTLVRISIESRDRDILLTVADTGPGISTEAIPTLFDRFTQAGGESSNTRRSSLGLGLAIVQALAAASGYSVDVNSDERGTRFTLTLPHDAQTSSTTLN